MKTKHLILLLLTLPILAGCDNSDDVIGIFTGKRWKLTMIFYNENNSGMDYWTSQAAQDKSEQLMEGENNFILSFEGADINEVTGGGYSGRAVNGAVSGNWTANGKNQAFSTSSQQAGSESDPLAIAYVNAIKNAYKYNGDYQNLRIYFTETQNGKKVDKFMLFHIEE